MEKYKISINNIYLREREMLINFIIDLSKKMKFKINTAFLAIAYLDKLLSMQIFQKNLKKYAVSSLILACKKFYLLIKLINLINKAKISENHELIPNNLAILYKLKPFFSLKEINSKEAFIGNNLKWNLEITTILEIVDFLLVNGVVYSSDFYSDSNDNIIREIKFAPKQTIFKIVSKIQKEAYSFSEKILKGKSLLIVFLLNFV